MCNLHRVAANTTNIYTSVQDSFLLMLSEVLWYNVLVKVNENMRDESKKNRVNDDKN